VATTRPQERENNEASILERGAGLVVFEVKFRKGLRTSIIILPPGGRELEGEGSLEGSFTLTYPLPSRER